MPKTQRVDLYVAAHTADAQRKLGKLSSFMQKFGESLRIGFGIDIARRLTDLSTKAVRGIEDAIRVGIRFNDTLENAKLSIAAVLRSASPEAFRGFNEALISANEMVRGLRREALRTKATFEELVKVSQGIVGPAIQAGIPIEKIPEIVSLISRAVSVARPNAPMWQTLQEARSLLTGQIDVHADVARMLGITRQEVMQAQQQGRMYEFLVNRLGAFNTAADRAANTISVLRSNLKDLYSVKMGEVTEKLVPQIKEGYQWLARVLEEQTLQRLLDLLIDLTQCLLTGLSPVLKVLWWLLQKMVDGFHLLYYAFKSIFDFIATLPIQLLLGRSFKESIIKAGNAAGETLEKSIFFGQKKAEEKAEQTAEDAAAKRTAAVKKQNEELKAALNQQLRDLNSWWRSILGMFEQKAAIRVEHGLGYTYGAVGLERETMSIQRSILDSLRQIYARLQAGIQVKLDSLEL